MGGIPSTRRRSGHDRSWRLRAKLGRARVDTIVRGRTAGAIEVGSRVNRRQVKEHHSCFTSVHSVLLRTEGPNGPQTRKRVFRASPARSRSACCAAFSRYALLWSRTPCPFPSTDGYETVRWASYRTLAEIYCGDTRSRDVLSLRPTLCGTGQLLSFSPAARFARDRTSLCRWTLFRAR